MKKQDKRRHVFIPEELFTRIASGDDSALEDLYYLSYRPIYAFLISLTLNKEDADDLLQDTYLRIREAAHLYRHQGNPMAWMMKISKNLFLMKKRKEKGKETIHEDGILEMMESTFHEIDDVENRIFLEELFLHITDEEREIILMNVLSGLTFREIAGIMNKPLGTVLSKYHRAVKKLRRASEKMEKGDD